MLIADNAIILLVKIDTFSEILDTLGGMQNQLFLHEGSPLSLGTEPDVLQFAPRLSLDSVCR